jgi:hypothetical protein
MVNILANNRKRFPLQGTAPPVDLPRYQEMSAIQKKAMKNRLKSIYDNPRLNEEAKETARELEIIRSMPFYGTSNGGVFLPSGNGGGYGGKMTAVRPSMRQLSHNEDAQIENYLPWYVGKGGSLASTSLPRFK